VNVDGAHTRTASGEDAAAAPPVVPEQTTHGNGGAGAPPVDASRTTPDDAPTTPDGAPRRRRRWPVAAAYLVAIVVGSALIVSAALTQPYNQNELQQVNAYRFDDYEQAISGTRQPPLGPSIGVVVQRTLGVGQIEQRLESVLPAIGTLIVLSALFARLRLGLAGAAAVGVVATAPLMVRYSAYARPYALPLFLMVLCAYLLQRWLDTGRITRLVGVLAAAALMPLARVPEPTVFLATAVVALVLLGWRGPYGWRRTLPALIPLVVALVAVAYPQYQALQASVRSASAEANPLAVLSNLGPQVDGLVTILPRVLAESFPWWPTTLALVVTAAIVPSTRRWLTRTWTMWVLLAPPVAWAVYYHLAIQTPAEDGVFGMIYQPRFAYFFVPTLGFAAAALAGRAVDRTASPWTRAFLGMVLIAVVAGQFPAAADVLRHDDSADWATAARMIDDLPDDAVVLYDNVAPPLAFRHPFIAAPRYLTTSRRVLVANLVPRGPRGVPPDLPLYVLLLGPSPRQPGCEVGVGAPLTAPSGWTLREHDGRFSLFEQSAVEPVGAAEAFLQFGDTVPARCGYVMTAAGAALLARYGAEEAARAELIDVLEAAAPGDRRRIRRSFNNRLPELMHEVERLPSP
jgi:hypothetical protein